MNLAVQVRGVSKRFRDAGGRELHALQDISLEVPAGTLSALVGPDGAGKTTLLRVMAGLLRADQGSLRVLDIDVARDPQAVQDRISYMPQRFGLYEDLSVQENLDLYADLHGVMGATRTARFARLLHMTDLAEFTTRPAGKLSGGMKQKLGLACTLVRSPQLLLLDEPTVGVDPLPRRELWQIVQRLIDEEHLSVLVSTAYLDEAERCAQVFMMVGGSLLAQGRPAELTARAQDSCFLVTPSAGTLPRTLQARLLDQRSLVIDAVPDGDHVRLVRDLQAPAAQWQSLAATLELSPTPARLEDGFMALLRRTASEAELASASAATPALMRQDASPSGPMIQVRDLVRRFGDFTAVASTSFSVARGEIFGLLGPNGAGKTTTFRMLCGLLPPTSGSLSVAGVDLRTAPNEARRHVGYVSQKFALYGNLSVRENLSFFSGVYGLRGAARQSGIEAALEEFDLRAQADQSAGLLPGGFRQRLAMAAALLHQPQILFLDEPTSGLDPLARRAFWRRMTGLAAAGVTVVVTTHFMEEAEYCDRIVIQDEGRLLALGSPQQVRSEVGAPDMNEAFIRIVERNRARAAAAATERAA